MLLVDIAGVRGDATDASRAGDVAQVSASTPSWTPEDRVKQALEEARAAIADMPAGLRKVIVLRDVQGRTPLEVQDAMALTAQELKTSRRN